MSKDERLEAAISTIWYILRVLKTTEERTRQENMILRKVETAYNLLTVDYNHWTKDSPWTIANLGESND